MKKVYISVDLEGLPGVVSLTMLSPSNTQFQRASKVMTKIVNELAGFLYENGVEEVVVADSHGLMTNIDYLEVDERVTLIQGYPRPFSMLTGLDSSFDAAMFVGYHAAAGTPHGTLDHTMSGRTFWAIEINGVRASEFLVNSLYAGELGVPVILLAGDCHLKKEIEEHYPSCVFVELKKGISRYAASYPGLGKVIKELRTGLAEALRRHREGRTEPLRLEPPYKVRLYFRDSLLADILEAWNIMRRIDAYAVEFEASKASEVLGVIELVAYIGYGVESMKANIK